MNLVKGGVIMFTKTLKLHFVPDDSDIESLITLTSKYRDACNYVSQYVFDNGFNLNQSVLHNNLYHSIRESFGLKSQATQSTFKTVIARYKTSLTQLSQSPYCYKDDDGVYHSVPRDLSWLSKPIVFTRPRADLVYNRDYRFKDNFQSLRVTTMDGLIDVFPKGLYKLQDYFDGSWSFGTAKLVQSKNKWYLHIPISKDLPEFDSSKVCHVVGIDRGLRQLMTCHDESGKTLFFNGQDVIKKRRKYKELRRSLQQRNTKGSKRRLRLLEHKENRWMTDVNHQLSKALIAHYGSNTLFVMEDLTNIRFVTETSNKESRYEMVSWAFYQLEQMLRYKAREIGSELLLVSPMYTSQRCPKCGTIDKTNRKHDIHEYHCGNCGYRSNDDRLAAINIQQLGTRYISGESNPRYTR